MRIDRRRSRQLLSSNTQITDDNRIDLTPECISIVKPIERFSLVAGPLLFILGVQRRRSEYCSHAEPLLLDLWLGAISCAVGVTPTEQ
jgi:hypothetical protein